MKPLIGWCLAAGLVFTAQAKEPRAFVVVSADVNAAVAKEATDQPQTYAMYVAAFEEFGSVDAGGPPPPAAGVIAQAVGAALPTKTFTPVAADAVPDLVIACHWGELSPAGSDSLFQARPFGTKTRMEAMMMGLTRPRRYFSATDSEQLEVEGSRSRYFLMVTAYDAAALKEGREVIQWQTRMSADALATGIDTVWPVLVEAGRPYFAADLDLPELNWSTGATARVAATSGAPMASDVLPGVSERISFKFL